MNPKKSFFERHPDMEKFIGENLLNKIGIGILVMGIAYFVKYAFDMQMVSDWGKIFTGLASGGILIGVAHRLRDRYRAFSSVLVGGGLAIFYFTLSIAYKEFELLSQPVAFISMVAVSALSVFLSMMYDRKELAILSLLGGFASPFLVATGEGNYEVLFTYIAILNAGMLVLAYFKKWNVINLLSFLFTTVMFGAWIVTDVLNVEGAPYLGALIFGTIFYLEFFYMNVVNNVRSGSKFSPREIFMLLANTGIYYSAGMYVLQYLGDGNYQGLFTAGMALVNFIFAITVYRKKDTDKVLLYLLTGLVLSFLSLVAPVQLHKYSITLFWACEAVLLLWLSQRSKIKLLRTGSVLVSLLMVVSLAMDWFQIYITGPLNLPVIINQGFVTSIVALVSLILGGRLLKKDTDEHFLPNIRMVDMQRFFLFLTLGVAFLTGLFEVRFQAFSIVPFEATQNLILLSYLLAWILGVLIIAKVKGMKQLQDVFTVIGLLVMLCYGVINQALVVEIRNAFVLGDGAGLADFLFHYVVLGLVIAIFQQSFAFLKQLAGGHQAHRNVFMWVIVAAGVYIASVELDHIVVALGFNVSGSITALLHQNHKVGWPILWGVLSFGMMLAGMRRRFKPLRIAALTLFMLTLVKLFVFDLRGISEFGKIAAFISLGVLLLVVSFLYQKLKVLLVDDPTPGESEEILPSEAS